MKDSVRTWHKRAMAVPLDDRSLKLRREIIEILGCSRRGHLGASFSVIEILRVLYDDILCLNPRDPRAPERDRCILSKGHGCLAQYVMLAEKKIFPRSELHKFCQTDAILGGHPAAHKIPGIEASTGSLGHGLPIAIGFAIAARFDHRNSKIFVILGDGECNEGSVWEAAMSAGKNNLDNLCVLIDYNKYQSYDETCLVQEMEPFADKWRCFGFQVFEVNGHDVEALRRALGQKTGSGKPRAIICHTVKGKGVAFVENNLDWHHKSKINDDEMANLLMALNGNELCAKCA